MKRIVVRFYYVDDQNRVLYKEDAQLTDLPSGEARTWGLRLRQVAGYKTVRAAIIDVEW